MKGLSFVQRLSRASWKPKQCRPKSLDASSFQWKPTYHQTSSVAPEITATLPSFAIIKPIERHDGSLAIRRAQPTLLSRKAVGSAALYRRHACQHTIGTDSAGSIVDFCEWCEIENTRTAASSPTGSGANIMRQSWFAVQNGHHAPAHQIAHADPVERLKEQQRKLRLWHFGRDLLLHEQLVLRSSRHAARRRSEALA